MKKIALSLIFASAALLAAEGNATAPANDGAQAAKQEATAAANGAAGDAKKGASLYNKCAGCHGKDGKQKALGKSAPIAGLPADQIVKDLEGYKAGTLNKYGMGGVMKGQAAALSDQDIKDLAAYISSLK